MRTDGEIDYAKYTPAQLRDALSTIDEAQYPLNFRRLKQAIELHAANTESGLTLPERLVLASRWSLVVNRSFPVIFFGIGAVSAIWLIFWPQSYYLHLETRGLNWMPRAVRAWLAIAMFLGAGTWLWRLFGNVCQVTLFKDQLEIRSVLQRILVPLNDVDSITWLQRASPRSAPIVALKLKRESPLGSEIKFVPSNLKILQTFESLISRRDTLRK